MRSAVAAVLFLIATAAAAQTPQVLTLDQYMDWERVSSPRLSPDGSQVIYSRRWVDRMNDRWESSLWMVNRDGTRNRFLVDGGSPEWSPDGTRIAYTARGEPSGSQIFVRWMDAEGATSQITRVTESPSNLAWSPDGKWIAFTMLVPKKDRWAIDMPAAPEGAKWTPAPRIVQRVDYTQDRVGFLEEGFRHIFVVPADGGTPRQITSGDYNHGAPEWSPDGRTIYFSGLREDDAEYQLRESEVYAVDVATGVIRQLTDRDGPDGGPAVSPDGRTIAYTGYDSNRDTYNVSSLYVMGSDGSNPRSLTPELDRSPGGLIWAEDGSGIYFTVAEQGTANLYFADLRGRVRKVTDGQHMLRVDDIRAGRAAAVLTSPQAPEDVVVFELRRPAQRAQLTHVNDDVLAGRTLGEVEEIWYGSLDDYRIQGWIVKPPDFDPSRKYPLMLSIHGGPHGMYGTGFNFGWQEHAANGYVVLYTNPRGSDGYGKTFGNAINNAYPSKDYDDLMAGVDTLVNRGYIDDDNMFVYGCSGGGVLTAWIVGHTDRFRAASANCPVTDWISFVGVTDGPYWYSNFAKPFWEDPSEHLRRSPIMYVGNVTTPTMLMTGVLDLRTPMSQTEEYYQALKMRKIPTAMVRFNNEWHGTSSTPSNFLRTQLYLRYWFEKWGDHDDAGDRATTTDSGSR